MTTDGRYRRKLGEPMNIQTLASLISTELRLADNDNDTEIVGNAQDAYRYFLLRPKGDEEVGKSKVQDGTVADVVDATMASLQPLYTVDNLIELGAEGPNDEEQAKQETKALNWYFRERLRGHELLDTMVQDALLVRNGYLKIWPETSWRLPYETTLEGPELQVEMELATLIQSGAQVKEYSRVVVRESQVETQLVYDESGIEMVPVEVEVSPRMVRSEVQIIERVREVKADTIPREDFGTSQDARGQNLQQPRFNYHRRRMTRNAAVALGFYADDIWHLENEDSIANLVNNEREEGVKQNRDSTAADRGGDIVSIYECWYHVDTDGDNIAELHHVFYGRTLRILRWAGSDGEPGPYADEILRTVPVASAVALRVSHRHLGRSLYDKEKNTEDIRTVLKRQMNDNLYSANDREFILGPGASEDDFELGFSGGFKRCSDVAQVRQIEYNPIISESLNALAYYDQQRSERGGGALDTANSQKPVNVQASVYERWMGATERTSAMYMRNLALGIRDAFILLHMSLRTLGEEFDYQDGEKWKKAQPRFWIDRERFSVKLGKSEGERNRLIAGLENQIEKAGAVMERGGNGVIMDWSGIYELLEDQADLMGVQSHWLDPDRPVGQTPDGQPITALMQSDMSKMRAAEEAKAEAERQTDKMLAAQMQISSLQEETSRLNEIVKAQVKVQENTQKALDSIRDFVNAQTKLEVESGQDIAGGVLYGDEELAERTTQ